MIKNINKRNKHVFLVETFPVLKDIWLYGSKKSQKEIHKIIHDKGKEAIDITFGRLFQELDKIFNTEKKFVTS